MAVSDAILPISELSAYLGKWTVKAKVTEKAPMRTFKRGGAGTEGKVFSFTMVDAGGGDIRATCFNAAADRLFDMLVINKIYTFSRGNLKIANKQYNSTSHKYEITFENDAQVFEVTDAIDDIAVKHNFVDLKAVQARTLPARVDICGIVTQYRPVQTVMSKEGKELVKRDITVADDTATSMEVTLWGDKAKIPDTDFDGTPVVALKSILIKEWNGGRAGSSLEAGSVTLRSDLPEAKRLEKWWSEGGGSTQSLVSLKGAGGGGRNFTECSSISQMRRLSEEVGDQQQTFSVTARFVVASTRKQGEQVPLHYNACAETREGAYGALPCNRRVDSSGFCAACDRAGKSVIRVNARCKYADYADGCWLTTFHEPAEVVLGMSGDQISEKDGENFAGREGLEAAIRQRCFLEPFQLKVRAKLDSYGGETRTNVSCIGAAPVNRSDHGRKLLAEIKQMIG